MTVPDEHDLVFSSCGYDLRGLSDLHQGDAEQEHERLHVHHQE